MLKTVLKYSAAAIVGAVTIGVGMHYGDDKILESIKQDLDDVCDKAVHEGTSVKNAVETLVESRYKLWVQDLILASSVRALDEVIEDAKNS